MMRFDIKSLFTSVSVDQASDVIRKILQQDKNLEKRTKLKVNHIMSLLDLCLTTTTFRFCETHYKLEDGLPMGSPVSPCVANLSSRNWNKTH